MVNFTKLLLTAIFVIGAIIAHPALHPDGKALSFKSTENEGPIIKVDGHLTKRTRGRQLLQWSPDGTILYLLGNAGVGAIAQLPQEITDMILSNGPGGPGSHLIRSCREFIIDTWVYVGAWNLFHLQV